MDSRKLLETPRNVIIVNRAGGKYWHHGIKNCLNESFSKLTSNFKVEINLNIDGLPLFKSSPLVFLAKFNECAWYVFIAKYRLLQNIRDDF